jgi:hypothetical protein
VGRLIKALDVDDFAAIMSRNAVATNLREISFFLLFLLFLFSYSAWYFIDYRPPKISVSSILYVLYILNIGVNAPGTTN